MVNNISLAGVLGKTGNLKSGIACSRCPRAEFETQHIKVSYWIYQQNSCSRYQSVKLIWEALY